VSPLLRLERLEKHFQVKDARRNKRTLRAVDGVSLDLAEGEILGLVGESGCGKSTLGKTLIGVQRATSGEIVFEGEPLASLDARGWRKVRRRLQYVYQDPGASLDPRWTIGRSLEEPLVIHGTHATALRKERVRAAIRAVGLREEHLALYPHELSGGQQRRVGLARVLTLEPRLIVLDEPTSGLDVSVQATILKLLLELWRRFNLTLLFISHDLGVVRMMCHRVAVMYLGRIVEIGPTAEVFARPQHPYTRSLLAAVPEVGVRKVIDEAWLEGEPPDPIDIPTGCRFRPRCPLAEAICTRLDPALLPAGEGDVACHLAAGRTTTTVPGDPQR
jgi:oligopeptide transport system ATP-binding protein